MQIQTWSFQTLKLNDFDNKCVKHHNKFYEYFCKECNQNFCSLCTEHKDHEEIFSSCDFIPTEEIKKLKKSNELFKKEIEILPYLIKINDLLITCQSKFSFNYFHNINLKNASNSFLQTDLFLKEINEIQEKIKSEKPNLPPWLGLLLNQLNFLIIPKKKSRNKKNY